MNFWECARRLLEEKNPEGLDRDDPRIQGLIGWAPKDEFVTLDTFYAKATTKIAFSRKHWREVKNSTEGQTVLWDQVNQTGVSPITVQAKQIVSSLAKVAPDTLTDVALLEPSDVPESMREKIFTNFPSSKEKAAGADAVHHAGTPHQSYAGKSLRNSWEKLGDLIR